MLILACDTSNSACSACLYRDGRVIAQSLLSTGRTHSLTFMPMVHDLMKLSGLTYPELDAFACTVGPGSFTGIRIGVSAVKAMAMAADKPAVPVSSLAALAFPFCSEKNTLVVAMTDARNRRVFSSAYFEGTQVIQEKARTIEDLMELCAEWEKSFSASGSAGTPAYILCGDAAATYTGEDFFCINAASAPELFGREIQPVSVAELAFRLIGSDTAANLSERFPPQMLMPVYRARTSAERLFSQKEEVHD